MMKCVVFNAAEQWLRETYLPSIPTFSQNLDKMLGNDGILLGSITELIGLPGTGKTQLCLQLCASVQIPKTLGGLDSEALYIDTNTNFTLSRFREILSACVQRCHHLMSSSIEYNEEEALKRLHYVNAFGLEKYCAYMHCLPKYLTDLPRVKLIIIDSIVFPFKEGISAKQTSGLLFRQMAELQRTAAEKRIAVVVTNEMTTRLGLMSGPTVCALGDAWAHRCNKRVLLTSSNSGRRLALLMKSNDSMTTVAEFQITKNGIRDVE